MRLVDILAQPYYVIIFFYVPTYTRPTDYKTTQKKCVCLIHNVARAQGALIGYYGHWSGLAFTCENASIVVKVGSSTLIWILLYSSH